MYNFEHRKTKTSLFPFQNLKKKFYPTFIHFDIQIHTYIVYIELNNK